jgi:hypothetical protein
MENLENIVKSMEMTPFNIILSKYGEKLSNFNENLKLYKE